jgi:hypothetical protein
MNKYKIYLIQHKIVYVEAMNAKIACQRAEDDNPDFEADDCEDISEDEIGKAL